MKKIALGIVISSTLVFTSCTKLLDKPMNSEDFDNVKVEISNDKAYSPMKSKYIVDNLSEQLGFITLGKTLGKELGQNVDEAKIPTFRESIADLSTEFDSIQQSKIEIKENNKKIDNFIELLNVNTTSIDKYNGYFTMNLKFNNEFEKEVLYIILKYSYTNKYDTKFFEEKSKLTDEVAENFEGEVEIMTTEKYNDAANFMYTKVPERAEKALRDELGDDIANEKVKREFLMEGFKVETLGIVFKDKSELMKQDADWEYLVAQAN